MLINLIKVVTMALTTIWIMLAVFVIACIRGEFGMGAISIAIIVWMLVVLIRTFQKEIDEEAKRNAQTVAITQVH